MNIILGGTHGLGEKITQDLRDRGKEAFVVGRSYDEPIHGSGMALDLLQQDDADELTRFITMGERALSGFYWVAGYGYKGDFAEQPRAREMALTNFANVIPIAQAAWKRMQLENSSRFVVVSSTSGVRPRADEALYAATKHAQVGFARSLGLESERLQSGVKVALFMPGGMRTPFWGEVKPESYDEFLDPARVAEEIVGRTINQEEYYQEKTFERGSL